MKYLLIATAIFAAVAIPLLSSMVAEGKWDGRIAIIMLAFLISYCWAFWAKDRRQKEKAATPAKKIQSLGFYQIDTATKKGA